MLQLMPIKLMQGRSRYVNTTKLKAATIADSSTPHQENGWLDLPSLFLHVRENNLHAGRKHYRQPHGLNGAMDCSRTSYIRLPTYRRFSTACRRYLTAANLM